MFNPIRTAAGLPIAQRTIGLTVDANGFEDLPNSNNPAIAVYDDINITIFLLDYDQTTNAKHQLTISLPTTVKSSVLTSYGQIAVFSFTAMPSGTYKYCDAFNKKACGTFQVKVYGDVNGDNVVDNTDYNIVKANYGQFLNSSWNIGDKPYLDGRIDFTDFVVVDYFLYKTGPFPTPYNPDVNGDGIVNIVDISIIGARLGLTAPSPFNNPNQGPDLNYDNQVNIIDVSGVAAHIGCTPRKCP